MAKKESKKKLKSEKTSKNEKNANPDEVLGPLVHLGLSMAVSKP